MPKKAEKKKKEYQRRVLAEVRKGNVNHADGMFRAAKPDSGLWARMDNDMQKGYKV